MASAIESLPTELLEAIVENIGRPALACLVACSRGLHDALEPILYTRDGGANNAMQWACKTGQARVIRLAVSYGAPVNTFTIQSSNGKRFNALTLGVVAKENHIDAFKTLLDLGARVDRSDPSSVGILLRRLYSRDREEMLRLFLEARMGSQTVGYPRDKPGGLSNGISLASLLHLNPGASQELVQLMLDNGADLDLVEHHKGGLPVSPLSAAVDSLRVPLFEFLLEKGANINGTDITIIIDHPDHIPIFTAARKVAQSSGMSILEKCVERGASINRRHPVKHKAQKGSSYLFLITPLFTYLDSIASWEPVQGHDPVDVVEYFLKHGAELEYGLEAETTDRGVVYAETPSAIELLTDRWGFGQMAIPEFFRVVKFLATRGSLGNHSRAVTRTLRNHVSSQDETHQRLIDLVVKEKVSDEDQELKNIILHCYASDVALSGQNIGEKERARVVRLIEEGADINARFGYMKHTALGYLQRAHREHKGNAWVHYRDHIDRSKAVIEANREKFMSFLSGLGAEA